MVVTYAREVNTMRALQVSDRCDRCSAQAFILATRGNSELMFCGHHGRDHFDSLTEQGFYLDDQTQLINAPIAKDILPA